MTHQDRSLAVSTARSDQRSGRINLGAIRARFVKPLRSADDNRPRWEQQVATWVDEDQDSLEDILSRFPIVRQGYDCVAVDEYIAELERELSEVDRELAGLRGRASAPGEVESEIKRIGEQTSTVLIAANEQRETILREAREEAERLISEASAKANAVSAEGEARLRKIEAQHESTQRERDRLLEDVRAVSGALAELVDSAYERVQPRMLEATRGPSVRVPPNAAEATAG